MRVWVCCMCGLVAAPALADDVDVPDTVYEFDDEHVDGSLDRPRGEVLRVRTGGRRGRLVRVRAHFIPELLHAVEQL